MIENSKNIEYMTIKEASIRWNMDESKIGKLIRANRISGITKIGCHWLIPINTSKPIDGRTKLSKDINKENIQYFRYPNYFYQDINTIYPSLSKEEIIIKNTVESFLSCNYQQANDILGNLMDNTNNRYTRIYSLYVGCMIDILLNNKDRFKYRFNKLNLEFKIDFPYKKEMSYLLYELDSVLGYDKYFSYDFSIDPTYNYHPSFLPHLIELNSVAISYHKNKTIQELESICLSTNIIDESKYPFDMQSTYLFLGNSYAMLGKTKERDYYHHKALDIAFKYNSFFGITDRYYYFKKIFEPILSTYPTNFINKLDQLSNDARKRVANFIKEFRTDSIYNLFPQKDYLFIFFALNNYTNKEIASILNQSEISIAKKYSEIYDIARVRGKNNLIDLFNNSVNKSIINK